MTETPARKHLPVASIDGDGTDTEINRKLTDHLRANAIRLGADSGHSPQSNPLGGVQRKAAYNAVAGLGRGLFQVAGLMALAILIPLAALHARFYEKDAG